MLSGRPNGQVRLISRPTGIAQAQNFDIATDVVREPGAGEILVKNHFLSVDPAMRGWIADTAGYATPVPLGSVMRAIAAGEVVASRHPAFAIGDWVTGWFGWQQFATVDQGQVIRKIVERDLPMSTSLGILGLNGVTALLALSQIGAPKAGETVVVSTAAGAVGSVVGQIARLRGCRSVGIAGGPDKVRSCLNEFGYDVAIDYRAADLSDALARACPNGVDVYFDNTCGRISDVVHRQLALRARVVICGTAAIADWSEWPLGPRVERHLLVKRARMEGFVLFDHMEEYEPAVTQLASWVRDGTLRYREDILDGLGSCPDALAGLYRGENRGKRLIRL